MFLFSLIKDILINSTNTGLGGRLYCRLRYLKLLTRSEKNPTPQPEPQNVNSQHSMDALLWLKTIVVSDTNVEEIRAKLELTRSLRDEMVLNDSVELIQEFPLLFTHPPLVNIKQHLYTIVL